MIETHLSIFDAVVIGIMLASCLFAFFRGFVREILSLGAWIGAAVVTLYYFPTVAEKIQPQFKNPVVAAGFATLGLYIGALILFSIVNMFILKFIKSGEEIGPTDNIFGLIFGAARGAFIISLGFLALAIALPESEYPDWLKSSVSLPYVEKGALLLVSAAPEYVKDFSTLQQKMAEKAQTENKSLWNGDEKNEESGYSRDAKNKLDRLIENINREE